MVTSTQQRGLPQSVLVAIEEAKDIEMTETTTPPSAFLGTDAPQLPRSRSPNLTEEGDLLRLVYCSKLVVPDGKSGQEMISTISKLATAFNQTVGITGGMYYNSDTDMVVQILEGLHCKVDMLIEKIRTDTRHVNFRVIERSVQAKREFEEWGMKECTSEEMRTPPTHVRTPSGRKARRGSLLERVTVKIPFARCEEREPILYCTSLVVYSSI